MTVFLIGGTSKEGIVRRPDLSKLIGVVPVMRRIGDLMVGMDIEAAIRIEVGAEVVDEAEAILIVEVGEEVVPVGAEVVIAEEGEVGKEVPINRSMTWALVVVATMHREGSQITTIMSRVEIPTT